MRHAILGAGGIGGLIGTILSAGGEQVTAVVRAASVTSEPRDYQLEHDGTGTARGPVTVGSALGGEENGFAADAAGSSYDEGDAAA